MMGMEWKNNFCKCLFSTQCHYYLTSNLLLCVFYNENVLTATTNGIPISFEISSNDVRTNSKSRFIHPHLNYTISSSYLTLMFLNHIGKVKWEAS